jgi:hypothetical protein
VTDKCPMLVYSAAHTDVLCDEEVFEGAYCPAHTDPSDGLWDRADEAYAELKEGYYGD